MFRGLEKIGNRELTEYLISLLRTYTLSEMRVRGAMGNQHRNNNGNLRWGAMGNQHRNNNGNLGWIELLLILLPLTVCLVYYVMINFVQPIFTSDYSTINTLHV